MRRCAAAPAFILSAAIHAALYTLVSSVPVTPRRAETVNVEITEAARPPPVPEAKPEPPRELPKLAVTPLPGAPPARKPTAPPPPNAPPPPSAPPPHQAPVRIGISMSSTVEAGATAVPVGNTLYGKPPERAPDPGTVQPYRAERYAPPAELTTLPVPISTEIPKSEYPEEARRLGIEGAVRLRLRMDEEGRVREAVVLEDPGHGLGEKAVQWALKFRFRPARRGDQAIAAEIPYTVHFELP